MLSKFEGIVLRAKDYGESHQIVLVFTEHLGKFTVMARGSKKAKSRFRAVTEPFTQAQFVCFAGSGMPTLSQADILKSRHILRSDLLLTAYGAYWLELIDKLIAEKEPNPVVYRFLDLALDLLEKRTDPDILTRIFELKMLKIAGYQPVLHHCTHCHSSSPLVAFSVRQGGLLCAKCVSTDPEAIPVTKATARILPILQMVELKRLGEVTVKPETKEQLEGVICLFMDEYLSHQWKARHILKQLQSAMSTS
ncbi:DNA repair protein RecO [Thermoflavimicrobium dichotomicum]|uniref:DNA repair protein RecO n=1 Tax=Thermoflavimicrobium dichotomicum TaxID=46223 RepID=A0A1I3NHF9_9BACL|nr:DNA repair protein RecO [Thermoflavimicrobium dichotomicum]SFJ08691.1 DNA replication and repair protein RecO [Thermoflavimicrobium dichotomicum]